MGRIATVMTSERRKYVDDNYSTMRREDMAEHLKIKIGTISSYMYSRGYKAPRFSSKGQQKVFGSYDKQIEFAKEVHGINNISEAHAKVGKYEFIEQFREWNKKK